MAELAEILDRSVDLVDLDRLLGPLRPDDEVDAAGPEGPHQFDRGLVAGGTLPYTPLLRARSRALDDRHPNRIAVRDGRRNGSGDNGDSDRTEDNGKRPALRGPDPDHRRCGEAGVSDRVIAAVGDMMIGTDYPENHLPDDDGVGFLAAVTPWLWSADVTFGNLEGVLVDGGEPGKQCSNPKACYLFRSPSRYAYHYRAAGFDVLSLANNHARDFGEEAAAWLRENQTWIHAGQTLVDLLERYA